MLKRILEDRTMQQQQQYDSVKNAYSYASYNVSKTRQVIMVYDGIISAAQQARQAIEEGAHQVRFNALQKACTLLLGLQAALDYEQGGEISRMLDNFYFSIDVRLQRLNREPDAAQADRILKELRLMRDAWAEVDAKAAAQGEEGDINKFAPTAEKINSVSVSA